MKKVQALVLCLLSTLFFKNSACITWYGLEDSSGQNEVHFCIALDEIKDSSFLEPDGEKNDDENN